MASYAFASGQIRCLETRLLTKTDIERMVDAPDLESAFKVFNDTDYADNLLDVKPHEFKKALDDDFSQARNTLLSLIDNQYLVSLIFLKNDIRNIKLLFKSKLSKQEVSENLKEFGTATSENLKKYIIDEDSSVTIPDNVKKLIDEAKEKLASNTEPLIIDAYFDEIYFQETKEASARLKNKFISDFFSLQHKTNTLKFFIRAKLMDKKTNFVKDYLPSKYLNIYDRDLDEALRAVNWHVLLDGAIAEFINDKNLWKLEKSLEEAEIEYLRSAKRISYGPEVVIAYYYAKRNAIRNVRLIMTGKLNKVEPKKIKERIREIY